MKPIVTSGFIPPTLLQRLKTWAKLASNQQVQQQHHEKAETLREQVEVLAQQGKYAHAEVLNAQAWEHEQTLKNMEEDAVKELRVY